jgi:hypothetical protein
MRGGRTMKDLKRRYVYEDTYKEVIEWANSNGVRAPNYKENFPFFLQEYLKELGGGTQNVERV